VFHENPIVRGVTREYEKVEVVIGTQYVNYGLRVVTYQFLLVLIDAERYKANLDRLTFHVSVLCLAKNPSAVNSGLDCKMFFCFKLFQKYCI
jgi:hypothetical protein